MKMLSFCIALAAGEFAASFVPELSGLWPILFIALMFVVLFGFGLACKGWPIVTMVLLGCILYFTAASEREEKYRDQPWLRGQQRHQKVEERNIVNKELRRRIVLGLENNYEARILNCAILLGDKSGMSRSMKNAFVESGTMHVFAVSGLHIMSVMMVLTVALTLLGIPYRINGLIALPILWGYVYIIGCGPSAIRAAMMATFYYAAPIFYRKPDGLSAWSWTFLIVHVCNPLIIDNVGNALSFVVMLSVMLTVEATKARPWWQQTMCISLAAWLAGVPISAHVFGRITPGGLVVGFILVAVAQITVKCGVTALIISVLSTTIAAHLNNLSAALTAFMCGVARIVASIPGMNFEIERWSILQCIEWYTVIILVMILARMVRSRQVML